MTEGAQGCTYSAIPCTPGSEVFVVLSHHIISVLQVADFLAADKGNLETWGLRFWEKSRHNGCCEALALMQQQNEHMQHLLASIHTDVRYPFGCPADTVKKVPDMLLAAYACKNCLPSESTLDEEPYSREDFQLPLDDAQACRTAVEACKVLPELHRARVMIDINVTDNVPLAPQLATLRRFAHSARPDAPPWLPVVRYILLRGNIKRPRQTDVAVGRTLRLLAAIDTSHIVHLSADHVGFGDVGLNLLVPALCQMTRLQQLHLPGNGICATGAIALSAVLPCLPKLEDLSLASIRLGCSRSLSRSQADHALGAALAEMPVLAELSLQSAISPRARTGMNGSLLGKLGRSRTLQKLDVTLFCDGVGLSPPPLGHLTSLTSLSATLASQYDHMYADGLTGVQRFCTGLAALTRLRCLQLSDALLRHRMGRGLCAAQLLDLVCLRSALPALTALTQLHVTHEFDVTRECEVGVAGVQKSLSHLTNLQWLVLQGPLAQCSCELVDGVAQLQQLRVLCLTSLQLAGGLDGVTDITSSMTLPELRALRVQWGGVN